MSGRNRKAIPTRSERDLRIWQAGRSFGRCVRSAVHPGIFSRKRRKKKKKKTRVEDRKSPNPKRARRSTDEVAEANHQDKQTTPYLPHERAKTQNNCVFRVETYHVSTMSAPTIPNRQSGSAAVLGFGPSKSVRGWSSSFDFRSFVQSFVSSGQAGRQAGAQRWRGAKGGAGEERRRGSRRREDGERKAGTWKPLR